MEMPISNPNNDGMGRSLSTPHVCLVRMRLTKNRRHAVHLPVALFFG